MLDPTPDRVRAGYPVACEWAGRGDGAVVWLERATNAVVETLTTLLAATTPPTRLTVLARLVPAMDAGQYLIGRLMLPLAAARYAVSDVALSHERAPEVAVLRAVVDWGRAGLPVPMTMQDVHALYPVYAQQASASPPGGRRGSASSKAVPDERISRRVRRQVKDAVHALGTGCAGETDGAGSSIWLTRYGRDDLSADALLRVVADDTTRPRSSWSIPDAVWERAAAGLPPEDAARLARHQIAAGQPWPGYLLLRGLSAGLAPAEWDSLGNALLDDGRVDAARVAYRQAIDSGHPEVASAARTALRELDVQQQQLRDAQLRIRRGY